MDCRIELQNGNILNVKAVDISWSWYDLFETLHEVGEISDSDFDIAESMYDLDEAVGASISLLNSNDGRKTPTRKLGGNKFENTDSNKTKLRKLGNKSKDEKDNKKRLKPIEPKIKNPPIRKQPSKPREIPIVPSNTIQPRTSSTFSSSLTLKCSENTKEWKAILISEFKPSKIRVVSSGKSGRETGSIHLVLDDSGSMTGTPNEQLKIAADKFLRERLESETIYLHTICNSLTGSGSPNHVRSLVNQLGTPGWSTPMVECLTRVLLSLVQNDVVIFFTDGGSSDGDPVDISERIKQSGVRLITIGCGSGTNENLLRTMASSNSDFHNAKYANMIVSAFQAVAKSLQQSSNHSSKKKLRASPEKTAKQIRSEPVSGGVQLGGYSNPGLIGKDEGYEFIEEFNCHFCSSTDRIQCGFCGENTCAGGTKNNLLTCPHCFKSSEVELTTSGIGAGASRLGGKKGK